MCLLKKVFYVYFKKYFLFVYEKYFFKKILILKLFYFFKFKQINSYSLCLHSEAYEIVISLGHQLIIVFVHSFYIYLCTMNRFKNIGKPYMRALLRHGNNLNVHKIFRR